MRGAPWLLALVVGCGSAPPDKSHGTSDSAPTGGTGAAVPPARILSFEASATPGRAHQYAFAWAIDTAVPATLECVQEGDPLEVHRHEIAPATGGSWVLHGLLGSTTYDCTLTAGTASETRRITTGAPLPNLQQWRVEGDPDAAWGAYTILNQFRVGAIDQVVTVFDPQGRVRWTFPMPPTSSTGLEATWLGDRFLIGGADDHPPAFYDLDGDVIWQVPPSPNGERYHHEARQTPHGTLLALRSQTVWAGPVSWGGFAVEEWDPATGALLWTWSAQQGVDAGTLEQGTGDVYHANAVSWVDDALGRGVLVSLAHANKIARVDRDTDEVLWTFGDGGSFGVPDPADAFFGQHDPEWSGDRVLVHDNGLARPGGEYSRVTEYEVVQAPTPSATLVWEWTEPDWQEKIWGDADRLPDGTILLTRGHCSICGSDPSGRSNISVLDPDTGTRTWTLITDDPDVGVYRADRIDGCALFENARYCDAL